MIVDVEREIFVIADGEEKAMLHPTVEADVAQERYQDLLREAARERFLAQVRTSHPGRSGPLLMALGQLLIRCGLWLQARARDQAPCLRAG
jgi:aromatic ring-cleaving dioxygenase